MDNIKKLIPLLASHAKEEKIIDMQDVFYRFFMDSFGKIAFGTDINSLSMKDVPFAQSFDRAQSVLKFRFLNPAFKWTELFNPEVSKDFETVHEFGMKIVKDRRMGVGVQNDLISLFMNYKNTDDGSMLTDEQLVDHVINFLIAGRDTTAQALSWTLYCLSSNPQCVDKMLEEIERIMDNSTIPTYDQVRDMKYCKAVFNETLRLYPSVPVDTKVAVEDDVLPDGKNLKY